MKPILKFIPILLLTISCATETHNKKEAKKAIYNAERDFEKMAAEKGIAEAFYFYADDSASILRGKDSLIKGKENIKVFYSTVNNTNTKVSWAPDFVEVSNCGTLGYTYGKYTWTITDSTGNKTERKGIFHTVWKKQSDGSWKYVWD